MDIPTYDELIHHFETDYVGRCMNPDCEVEEFQMHTKGCVYCPNPDCGYMVAVWEAVPKKIDCD